MESFFNNNGSLIIPLLVIVIIILAIVFPTIIIIIVLIKVLPIFNKAKNAVSPQTKNQNIQKLLAQGGIYTDGTVKSLKQTGMQLRLNGIQYVNIEIYLEVTLEGQVREFTCGYMMDLVNPILVGIKLPVVVNFDTNECIIAL